MQWLCRARRLRFRSPAVEQEGGAWAERRAGRHDLTRLQRLRAKARKGAVLSRACPARQQYGRRCSILTSLATLSTVIGGQALAQSDVPQGYRLTFAEEFTALSLDEACSGDGAWATYWCKWNVRHLAGNNDQALKADPGFRGTGGPTLAEHGLITHERSSANTLKLYGWVLPNHIRQQFHDLPYVAGMISSERSHSQTYGYWEIRARFTNTSTGHHWALWLLPQDGSWPPEIDLAEVVGVDPRTFHMNAHGTGQNELVWFSPDDPTGWHTWGLLWTRDDLVWYVDGVERKRIPNYIYKPMYLLITPEIGGNWPGNPDASTAWPMEAEIDYVRVYEAGTNSDELAPSVPAGLTATAVSSAQIDLVWQPSSDDTGVSRYDVHRGSALQGATEDTFFNDTGLEAATAYTYRVRACDAAENCSEFTPWVSATTDDDGWPSAGDDLLEITDVEAKLAWKCSEIAWRTSAPADALVEYGTTPGALSQSVYRIALEQQHNVLLTGLAKKTLYYFRVISMDADGDVATSGIASFMAPANAKC